MPLTAMLADVGDSLPPTAWHATTLFEAILATALFGALGIALLFCGYKVFDWLTPHLHIEKELAEKNVAVAIVVGAMLVSLSIIVAKSVG